MASESEGSVALAASCNCGAFRLEVARGPLQVRACHCSLCRRQSGGALAVLAAFPREVVSPALEACQHLRRYRSSEAASRLFCGRCGCFLCMDRGAPETVWASLALFKDVPEHFLKGCGDACKTFIEDEAPWLSTVLALPAMERFGTYVLDPCNAASLTRWDGVVVECNSSRAARKPPLLAARCNCRAFSVQVAAFNAQTLACHCSLCRKQGGAPFIVGIALPREPLAPALAEAAAYGSTEWASRLFCATCGCFLCMDYKEPESLWAILGVFDDVPPEELVGSRHASCQVFAESKPSWSETVLSLQAGQGRFSSGSDP